VEASVNPTSSFPLGAVDAIRVGEITCCGVTWLDALDGADVPLILVAVTVKS
jgi:hypothetical protein